MVKGPGSVVPLDWKFFPQVPHNIAGKGIFPPGETINGTNSLCVMPSLLKKQINIQTGPFLGHCEFGVAH
jgi:hypothetical protein